MPQHDLIHAIRTIRSVNGMRLKESKDIADALNREGLFVFSSRYVEDAKDIEIETGPKKATHIRKLLNGPSFGFNDHMIEVLEAIRKDIEGEV